MRLKHRPILILFFLSSIVIVHSQPCNSLGQNPSTAFPVCGTATFIQNNVPICGGTVVPGQCGAGLADINPYWYRFTCYVDGTLGFLITPNNLTDDYDWQLFDITGRNPTDVYTDASLFVACNWSGRTGITGASSSGTSLANCAGSAYPLFSSMPTILAGHDYLLLISHYTNSQSGYQLSFTMGQSGGGTAAITDPANPIPKLMSATPNCDGSQVTIHFNKRLKCSSLTSNGNEFTISPTGTITTAAGIGCTTGFDLDSVILFMSAPLAAGNYTATIGNGTDGTTLIDDCDRPISVGDFADFTVTAPVPLAMGTINPPPCTPGSIVLNFAEPIKCSSIAADGSDFGVSGPGAVTVTGANAITCDANGETMSVNVRFMAPVLVTGTYVVKMLTGSDGNTLVGSCSRQVTAGLSTSFTLDPQPPLPLGTIDPLSCSPSAIAINFSEAFDCTSISPDGSEFVITGPSAVTIASATSQCSVDPNTRIITVHLANPITVSGSYQLAVRTGTDGNTIRGNCNRYISVGDFTTFAIPDAFPIAMDSIVPVSCSPSSLKLIFMQPIRCSSIAADGSDFVISNGPAPVAVTSATGNCDANGLTTSINIQLASPIVMGGSYQVQLVSGSDGNSLLSECNRPTTVGSTLNFTTSDTVSAEFQYQIQYDCTTDVIDFSHDGLHNVNQWTWTINGAAAGSTQTITQSFSAASVNTVQLTVSNGVCSDNYSTSVVLNNKVTVAFDLPESACPGDSVHVINQSKGSIDHWQWSFGNGNSSILSDPPAQIYPATGVEQIYAVSLIADNNNGCQATATGNIKILSSCIIAVPTAFTPNNDGMNDYLYPLNALKAEKLDFQIFNRWGQMLFHSNDWTRKWDGRVNGVPQATGVYIWMLEYIDKDTHQKYSMKGTTTLIR